MKLKSPFLVKPHSNVRLSHLSTAEHGGYASREDVEPLMQKHQKHLASFQEVLYAEQKRSVLIVLQGMDTAGKDGTISHIFSGINPQGCNVASFKVPTPLEARHDFLWRCHAEVPARGMIGIFNRSHYEDVLWPRVHDAMGRKEMLQHLDEINDFESMLHDNGTLVLKFFLHISREEQTRRLQSRIDTPDKRWKLSPADFAERRFWPQYMRAYEEIFSRTSRKDAPWFVIPADQKWFRNIAISEVLVEAFRGMKLKYPKPSFDPKGIDLSKEDAASVEKKVQALSASSAAKVVKPPSARKTS